MERSREARRMSMAAANGLARRRQRSSSLRDSPEDDTVLELQETVRLRDRGSVKKDRDRDRDRDRSSRSKRRRSDGRLMHGSHREDGGDETTDESVNEDEDEDDDDGGGGGAAAAASLRMLPPNPSSLSNNHHLNRKSFPPAKGYRAAAPPTWKAADEMIGVSVPRKARSASTKRTHEWMLGNNGGAGGVAGEQVLRQASTSPVRTSLVAAASSPAPISPPSSTNASARKKLKPNVPKQRVPKTSSKSSSSNQDEIEFEIAEVLYEMRQNQGPSKQEGNDSVKFETRDTIKASVDVKSGVSSPISNSSQPQASSILQQNSSSSAAPLTAIAPKRKKPRPMREEENHGFFGSRSSPISASATKAETEQLPKTEICSTNLESKSGSAVENGGVAFGLGNSQGTPLDSVMPDTAQFNESRPPMESRESKDAATAKEETPSSRNELSDNRDDAAAAVKANLKKFEIENHTEEKFQIDLMAPPPQIRSSPERGSEMVYAAVDPKPAASDVKTEKKEDEKGVKLGRDGLCVEAVDKKVKTVAEETDPQKRIVDHLDSEKHDRDSAAGSTSSSKLNQHLQKQHLHVKPTKDEPNTEKAAQPCTSLPLPMSMAGWPGGISPMGFMGPLQGVMSMDGSAVPPVAIQPPNSIFSQPRPKRCATHCFIARNICYHQQFTRMNSFWPAASTSAASLYGKPCNLNVVATTELHGGNVPGKNLSSVQDTKGQGLAIFPNQSTKEKTPLVANVADAAQRKQQQILLQQTLTPGAPSNLLHGPAFIFPINQQHAAAAAAASARPALKNPAAPSSVASTSMTNSASVSSAPAAAAAAATAMSFSYPNVPGNETQYLAILQNNGYPFPIPAHVGATPSYRGSHPQAMPFFSSSFYSSQMLHPSQLQAQQQQQQLPSQQQQMQQVHQNPNLSSGSSSSQKNLQNQQQQQRAHGSAISSGNGNLQAFPAPKNRPMQPTQQHSQHIASLHQTRHNDTEMGGEDSPSTADSRVSRANMGVYGQNFGMPNYPPNFALMTPPATSGGASGNHGEKRHQPSQPQGLKAGVEGLPSQAFAMSFASMSGGAPASGVDMSVMAQNHAILQSLPEHARHNYQIMAAAAAAQAAQQKKSYRNPDDGRTGAGDSFSNAEEERKAMVGKASNLGQSIAFSRPELAEASMSGIPGSNATDNSARTVNLGSVPSRVSGSITAGTLSAVNATNSQLQHRHQQQQQQHQLQQQQHQLQQQQQQQQQQHQLQQQQQLQQQHQLQQQQHQQQVLQLQKQQQPYAASRSKTPATSNGNAYSEHIPSSSMAAKFPNALSAFPQNLVQSASSPAHSPQWKNAPRASTSQAASPSMVSSAPSLKNAPQQQVRSQQNHTQISFGGSTKPSTPQQGQQLPNNNQSPSSPMMVGSPTTSSMSKGAGGSPRTTTANSTGSKAAQASSLSSQQGKNSPMPNRKSSPVGSRNVPSILGNPHITSSSNTGSKNSLQQQAQQQMSKQTLQQAQLFFSNPYVQAQAQPPHSSNATSTASSTSGYYIQRRRPEQQPLQGTSTTSSNGMLSLCTPVSLAGTSTSDAKAVAAAAASNMKGGGLPPQSLLHGAQFAVAQSSGNSHPIVPAGFPYVQSIPQAVQLKPAEQKQPAVPFGSLRTQGRWMGPAAMMKGSKRRGTRLTTLPEPTFSSWKALQRAIILRENAVKGCIELSYHNLSDRVDRSRSLYS